MLKDGQMGRATQHRAVDLGPGDHLFLLLAKAGPLT